jgi:hypothetical protein
MAIDLKKTDTNGDKILDSSELLAAIFGGNPITDVELKTLLNNPKEFEERAREALAEQGFKLGGGAIDSMKLLAKYDLLPHEPGKIEKIPAYSGKEIEQTDNDTRKVLEKIDTNGDKNIYLGELFVYLQNNTLDKDMVERLKTEPKVVEDEVKANLAKYGYTLQDGIISGTMHDAAMENLLDKRLPVPPVKTTETKEPQEPSNKVSDFNHPIIRDGKNVWAGDSEAQYQVYESKDPRHSEPKNKHFVDADGGTKNGLVIQTGKGDNWQNVEVHSDGNIEVYKNGKLTNIQNYDLSNAISEAWSRAKKDDNISADELKGISELLKKAVPVDVNKPITSGIGLAAGRKTYQEV